MGFCYAKLNTNIIFYVGLLLLGAFVNGAPRCKSCPAGSGRNVKNIQEGAKKCSPCEPCGPSQYSDSSTCRQCMVNCSKMNRKLQVACRLDNDAVCGSCLPGFQDEYSSVSLPCEKIPSLETKETKSTGTTNTPLIVTVVNDIVSDHQNDSSFGNIGRPIPETKEKDVPPFPIATVVPIGVGVLIVGLLIVVFVVFKNHPRVRRVIKAVCLLTRDKSQGFVPVETDAEIGPGQALLPQDLDTDGPDHMESTVTSCDQERPPHAELEEFRSSGPEAMSSQPVPSTKPSMAPSTTYPCGDSVPSTCSLCDVQGIPFQDFVCVILTRGDRYINYFSLNICHDPHELYKKLGVPYNKIYQNAEDQKVSPERCPCAQLVLNNLDDWVGVQGRPSLQILLTALCQAGFHKISHDLIEKYTTPDQP